LTTGNQIGDASEYGQYSVIQSAPLAPPNSPKITEADRSRIYGLIGSELHNALNAESAFFPDGLKKSSSDLMSNMDELIGTVKSLKESVDDPTNIFGDALRDLVGARAAPILVNTGLVRMAVKSRNGKRVCRLR
jgi:hypothetical protein